MSMIALLAVLLVTAARAPALPNSVPEFSVETGDKVVIRWNAQEDINSYRLELVTQESNPVRTVLAENVAARDEYTWSVSQHPGTYTLELRNTENQDKVALFNTLKLEDVSRLESDDNRHILKPRADQSNNGPCTPSSSSASSISNSIDNLVISAPTSQPKCVSCTMTPSPTTAGNSTDLTPSVAPSADPIHHLVAAFNATARLSGFNILIDSYNRIRVTDRDGHSVDARAFANSLISRLQESRLGNTTSLPLSTSQLSLPTQIRAIDDWSGDISRSVGLLSSASSLQPASSVLTSGIVTPSSASQSTTSTRREFSRLQTSNPLNGDSNLVQVSEGPMIVPALIPLALAVVISVVIVL